MQLRKPQGGKSIRSTTVGKALARKALLANPQVVGFGGGAAGRSCAFVVHGGAISSGQSDWSMLVDGRARVCVRARSTTAGIADKFAAFSSKLVNGLSSGIVPDASESLYAAAIAATQRHAAVSKDTVPDWVNRVASDEAERTD